MFVEISNGDLLDKFSILQIKLTKITDEIKLVNVRNEYKVLKPLCDQLLQDTEVKQQFLRLLDVNDSLWQIEDALREKERKAEFDTNFVLLARNVYFTNDRRAEIKREINLLTKSTLVEEKSYEKY